MFSSLAVKWKEEVRQQIQKDVRQNVCLLRWDRALGVKILEEMSNREREVQGTDVRIKRKRKFLKRQKHLGPGRRWESKPQREGHLSYFKRKRQSAHTVNFKIWNQEVKPALLGWLQFSLRSRNLSSLLRGRERLPTPVFWPVEFHGLYSPWGRKQSDTTERLSLILRGRRKEWEGQMLEGSRESKKKKKSMGHSTEN